jgi:hypothetical protein
MEGPIPTGNESQCMMQVKWMCRLDCVSSCMAIEMIFQKCTITFKSSKMPCPKLKCNLMSNGWEAYFIRNKFYVD